MKCSSCIWALYLNLIQKLSKIKYLSRKQKLLIHYEDEKYKQTLRWLQCEPNEIMNLEEGEWKSGLQTCFTQRNTLPSLYCAISLILNVYLLNYGRALFLTGHRTSTCTQISQVGCTSNSWLCQSVAGEEKDVTEPHESLMKTIINTYFLKS